MLFEKMSRKKEISQMRRKLIDDCNRDYVESNRKQSAECIKEMKRLVNDGKAIPDEFWSKWANEETKLYLGSKQKIAEICSMDEEQLEKTYMECHGE